MKEKYTNGSELSMRLISIIYLLKCNIPIAVFIWLVKFHSLISNAARTLPANNSSSSSGRELRAEELTHAVGLFAVRASSRFSYRCHVALILKLRD